MILFIKGKEQQVVNVSDRQRYLDDGWKLIEENVRPPHTSNVKRVDGEWKREPGEEAMDRWRQQLPEVSFQFLFERIKELEVRVSALDDPLARRGH